MKTRHLYSCDKCELILQTPNGRKQHGIDAHNEDVPLEKIFPNSCLKCLKPLSSFNEYAAHLKMHEKERKAKRKEVQCMSCEEKFLDEETMITHIKSFHGIDRLQCPQCVFFTFKQGALRKHMTRMHPSSEQTFACNLCFKQFPTVRLKQNHVRKVHKEKIKCTLCRRSFDSFSRYQLHAAENHSFDCSFCELKFINKFAVKMHQIKIHKGDLDDDDVADERKVKN